MTLINSISLKKFRFFVVWILVGVGSVVPAGQCSSDADLIIESSWSPSMPPNFKMHAGYFVVTNNSAKPIQIVGFSSDFYRSVSLHDTLNEDGVFKMVELEQLEIKPKQQLVLAPGGKHLMLMGPKGERTLNSDIPMRLNLKNGSDIEFTLRVKAR